MGLGKLNNTSNQCIWQWQCNFCFDFKER